MNIWSDIRSEYAAWLRTFPLVARIGTPGPLPEVVSTSIEPLFNDSAFWSQRTRETEVAVRRHLTDPEIDGIFDEVAVVLDENLRRFDPLVAYYGRFASDGDPTRIEWERDAAHAVKRDLAWAACERATGEPGFFSGLLPWYDRGRWPVGWAGAYPAGHVTII